MPGLLPLLGLAACESPPGGETTDGGTEDVEITSFDLDVTWGSCDALIDPWSATTADDALAVAPLAELDLYALFWSIHHYAMDGADDACPTLTTTSDTSSIAYRIEGECTSSTGWTYSGVAEEVLSGEDVAAGDFDAFEDTWEDFHLSYESRDGTYSFAADGTASQSFDEDGRAVTEAALVYGTQRTGRFVDSAYAGDRFAAIVGSWESKAGAFFVGSAYTRLLASDGGVTGDLCATWDIVDGACATEETGTVTLAGATTAEIFWDAETCDGCADVSIDGAPVGSACE